MNVLFFDTETTGFFNRNAPMDHATQPHIVQFAAMLCDEKEEVISQCAAIVCPPLHVEVPAQATAIHGISTEMARKYGISWLTALALLDDLAMRADRLVAHNIEFDAGVIGCMYARDDRVLNTFGGGPSTPSHFCTMKATTPLCKLPGNYGFKWPKLIEAYRHFFGCDFDKAHDALADVTACKRIYFELQSRNQPQTTSTSGGSHDVSDS